ncbi:hypothetical protein JT359_17035, partial [Candidatus Poribacteria bacterium]|nr:hypothetical protein [Candidatus Poribacteria bacterium]
MDKKDIRTRFKKLKVWQNGDERAPHKPLLVLYAIGKLLKGEDRFISYAEIEGELRNLLKDFGPWRKTDRPQDPFWRLKNVKDEKYRVWEIPNENIIKEGKRSNGKSTGDAIIADLRHFGKGAFIEPIANRFQEEPEFAIEIAKDLLKSHFTPSYHQDILKRVGIPYTSSIAHNQLQIFQDIVLKAYEYKCTVCGFDVRLHYEPIALVLSQVIIDGYSRFSFIRASSVVNLQLVLVCFSFLLFCH